MKSTNQPNTVTRLRTICTGRLGLYRGGQGRLGQQEGLFVGCVRDMALPDSVAPLMVMFNGRESSITTKLNGYRHWIGARVPDEGDVQLFAHDAVLVRRRTKKHKNGSTAPDSFELYSAHEFDPKKVSKGEVVTAAALHVDEEDLTLVIP